jgi:O-antigen ligase
LTVSVWTSRIALIVASLTCAGVLLVYTPGLEAPFLVPKFTILEIGAALSVSAFVLSRTHAGRLRWSPRVAVGTWLVLGTTAIAWLFALSRPEGAPYGLEAFLRWGAFFGMASGVSVLGGDGGGRRRLIEAVTIAGAAVAVLGLLQDADLLGRLHLEIPIISVPGSTFGNRNLAAEVVALCVPFGVALALESRTDVTVVAVFLTIVELAFVAKTRTRGAWVGIGCGVAATLIAWASHKKLLVSRRDVLLGAAGTVACLALLMVAIAALPSRVNPRDAGDAKRAGSVVSLLSGGLDPNSTALRTRFGIWRRSLRMIREHPLFGVGPGNWPVFFPHYAEPGATHDGVLSATLAPRQAHDDYVERTAETGVVGMGALVFLALTVGAAVRQRMRGESAEGRAISAGAAGSLAALLALVTGFPLEMPGTLVVASVAFGLSVSDGKRTKEAVPFAIAVPALGFAGALVFVACVKGELRFRGNRLLGFAERALTRDRGVAGAAIALPALDQSIEAAPLTYLTHLRKAQMLLREKRPDDAIAAVGGAIALEPYAPNGWGVLAAAHRAAGHVAESREAADRGIEIMHDYPLCLDIRAGAEERMGDLDAAREDRSRLAAIAEASPDEATKRTAAALLAEHSK